jgi:hypothetical protein
MLYRRRGYIWNVMLICADYTGCLRIVGTRWQATRKVGTGAWKSGILIIMHHPLSPLAIPVAQVTRESHINALHHLSLVLSPQFLPFVCRQPQFVYDRYHLTRQIITESVYAHSKSNSTLSRGVAVCPMYLQCIHFHFAAIICHWE